MMFVLALLFSFIYISASQNENSIKGFNATCHWKKGNPQIKAYWINLANHTVRKSFMERQLQEIGMSYQRIDAVTPASLSYNVTKLVKPCKRNTDKDVAVILSHLTAIHSAIHDTTMRDSDYALILEDDIRFKFDVDFAKLIESAPKGFGILQLVTSNVEAIHKLWDSFMRSEKSATRSLWTPSYWDTMTKDRKTVLFWSAQAYLIDKRVIRAFIDDVVDSWEGPGGTQLSFKIINSFSPNRCVRTKEQPCIISNCLFSDSYIYAGGGPTHVLNFPLFNGDTLGYDSSIHQDQVF